MEFVTESLADIRTTCFEYVITIRTNCLPRGMLPANELARKHPFILNCKLEPLRWSKLAVRGRLPVYTWNSVLDGLKANTGAFSTLQAVH